MFENHRKADEIHDPLMVVRGEKVVQEAEVERKPWKRKVPETLGLGQKG